MTSNETNSGIYSFNDIQVDTRGLKVTRAGQEIPLEPKAHSLLHVLLSRPGHAFTHQELLDAVWGHRHVTPGVLVRLIGMLRRALGNEDSHESYIQTIHGVGYRFDLPTGSGTRQSALSTETSTDQPMLPANALPGTPANEPARVATIEHVPAEEASTREPVGNDRRLFFLRLLLVAAVALLVFFQFRDKPDTSPENDSASNSPVLAVMPLRELDHDQRSTALAQSVSENIIALLSRTPGVRVIATTPPTNPATQVPSNQEMATQLRATHYLEGTIEHKQQRAFLNLRLVMTETRRTIWAQSQERQADEGFLLQRQIAMTTSKQIQKAMQFVEVPKNEDPALYKRYYWTLQNYIDAPRSIIETLDIAERDLLQITKEHPDYARAWGGLATLLWLSSGDVHNEREQHRQRAITYAKKALALNPMQADALSVLAGLACRDQRWDDCLALSEKALRAEPANIFVLGFHSHRLLTLGYVKQALKVIDDGLLLGPLYSPLTFFRARSLDTLGRHKEARDQLLANDMPSNNLTALYMNALWRNDFETAKTMTEETPLDYRWRASQLALSEALIDPSKWSKVEPIIEISEGEIDVDKPFRPYSLERLFLPKRDYARDIAGLNAMQVMGYTSYQWIFWQPESRELRASDAFRDYIVNTGLKPFWKKNGQPDFCTIDKVKEPNCE